MRDILLIGNNKRSIKELGTVDTNWLTQSGLGITKVTGEDSTLLQYSLPDHLYERLCFCIGLAVKGKWVG